MKNNTQTHATRKFNVLSSAESFKVKVQSSADIRVYKNGQFGVRFKIDKSIPVREPGKRIIFTKSNHILHENTL
jgi:hypothetical protein